MNAIGVGGGCGPTCIAASNYANQAETQIRGMFNAYWALPSRTQCDQQTYLNAFDTIWAALQASCGNPQLNTAGVNCITDRQAGACKWKQNSSSYPADAYASGEPQVGDCWKLGITDIEILLLIILES